MDFYNKKASLKITIEKLWCHQQCEHFFSASIHPFCSWKSSKFQNNHISLKVLIDTLQLWGVSRPPTWTSVSVCPWGSSSPSSSPASPRSKHRCWWPGSMPRISLTAIYHPGRCRKWAGLMTKCMTTWTRGCLIVTSKKFVLTTNINIMVNFFSSFVWAFFFYFLRICFCW